MADKIDVAKIVKLIELGHELHQKSAEVLAEIDALIGGKAGIGAEMKQAEAAFSDAWCYRYAPGYGKGYEWNFKADKPHVKRLVKRHGVEEFKRRALAYMRNDDHYYVRARHPFGLFVHSWNTHVSLAETVHRPVGCTHDPACLSDEQHTRVHSAEMRGEVRIF